MMNEQHTAQEQAPSGNSEQEIAQVKVSMNGFRRNLSGDVQELRDVAASIINDEWYDKADLAKAVNAVITHSNVLNCIYVADDPDFTDMGSLEVEHLEEEVES